MTQDTRYKLEYEIDKLSMQIDKCVNINFSINVLEKLSDKDLKEFIKSYVETIVSANSDDYFKCNYLGNLAYAVYPLNINLAKLCVKKALKYSTIKQMYGIAGECYQLLHDKSFSTKIYKKAIQRCYKENNTSRLHLLGQNMSVIDVEGYYNFQKWGNEIQAKAVKLSDKQKLKAKKMENKITYTQDTQNINAIELTPKKFLKKAKKFLRANEKLEKNEILYVVKASKTSEEEVIVEGAYYGAEISPLWFLVNSKEYSENVFLAEATSSEAIIEYLLSNKDKEINDNIYVFKVLYEDFKLCKIKSLYGGEHDLSFYIFDSDLNTNEEVLKRFGKDTYSPNLNFFLSKTL